MQKKPEAPATPVVFVIDDDASVRDAISRLIRSVGLRAEVFASVSEFLAHKRSSTTSCLILDVRLPGVSGLEFQSELAKTNSEIPIIFITGDGDIPMTVKAMKAGAIEFLTKPFRDQDLLDAIQVALERAPVKDEKDRPVSDLKRKVSTLTPREQEVMAWITGGLLNKPPPRLAPAVPPTPKPMPFQPFDRFRVKKPPANSTTIRRPSPPAHRQSLVGLSL